MSIDASKVTERSVDSIARIYAVVIALAISQAVQSFLKDANGVPDLNVEHLLLGFPALVAFLVTLVPFWHGMNRHLDRCYLEKTIDVVEGGLLLDFGVFFVEACFLFAAGWLLRNGIQSFICLGSLLVIDMLWGFVSHQIHFHGKKSHVVQWAAINVGAMFVAILVVAYPFERKTWVLMVVAVLRSIVDYWLGWEFYFPRPERAFKKEVPAL